MGNLNLRKFPEELARRLKSEAALAGVSMQEYCIGILLREAYPVLSVDVASWAVKKGADISDGGGPPEALPRGGKAQEYVYDGAGTRLSQDEENIADTPELRRLRKAFLAEVEEAKFIYGRSGIAPDFNEVHVPIRAVKPSTVSAADWEKNKSEVSGIAPNFSVRDLQDKLAEVRAESGEPDQIWLHPDPSDIRNAAGFTTVTEMPIEEAKRRFPEWSEARMREMAEAEDGALSAMGGLLACSPELYAEIEKDVGKIGGPEAVLVEAFEGLLETMPAEARRGLVDDLRENTVRRQEMIPAEDRADYSVALRSKGNTDMDALRDICAGNLGITDREAFDKGWGEQEKFHNCGDEMCKTCGKCKGCEGCECGPVEVNLCGFNSYNDVDGENYICGLEKHGPKVKHGGWIKV
jgi:hypothetical protein